MREEELFFNYMALFLAIVNAMSIDSALAYVENPTSKRKWTREDAEEIKYLRGQGIKWEDIGVIFNTTKYTVLRAYQRYGGPIR